MEMEIEIDRTNQDRYNENYKAFESTEFSDWFETIYGPIIEKGANDDYWTLRIYTLIGWLAKKDSTAYNRGYEEAICDAKNALNELNEF